MSQDPDAFAGVREFVETVLGGSFTTAGRRLQLTGSAVGKAVSRLEERLGTKLLHRTTRRLTLTPEGQRYFDGWLQILEDVRGLEGSIIAGSNLVRGQLRLHLPGAFGRRHVMPLLLQLANAHPALDLCVSFTEQRVNLIDEGVDLVVRIGTLADDGDLVARRLGRQRLVICASPGYLAAHGVPTSPADLTTQDCLTGSRGKGPATWLVNEPGQEPQLSPIRVRHEFSDGDALLAAALAGAGLAQLPTWLVQEQLASGALVPVMQDCTGAEMPIHAVWPRSRYLKPAQRAVIDALVEDASQPGSIYHA